MPYSHRKKGNKVEVFKTSTGEHVGNTTPKKLNKYLAALHIHSKEKDTGVESEIKKARKKRE
jgi:hypothetical protein